MVNKYANNPKSYKELKTYTAKKNGFTYKSSMALVKRSLGCNPSTIVNKLLKKIMCYYPYEFNSVRFDPHYSNNTVEISFPVIDPKTCIKVSNEYPKFWFEYTLTYPTIITNMSYESKKYSLDCAVDKFIFDEILTPINISKTNQFNSMLTIAGLPLTGKVTAKMLYTDDYGRTTKEMNWEADSYQKLFDDYVTANDRLKYCNGSYYRFANPDVENAYYHFIHNYEGNYFLDNAVRRGCIID